jgi:cystathionine beta-lyase/cystathionine gamma-synthase
MSKLQDDEGRFETRAIHAGQESDPVNGAIMTPVYFSSTFEQDAPAVPRAGYEYSRTSNPTRTALEQNLASLEGAAWGLCFASGLSATNALCDRLSPGDHVVAGSDLYGGTYRLFTKVFERYGVRFTFVDTADADAVRGALEAKTRMVYVETPSNPLLRLTDLTAMAEVAHGAGALLVVDNTFATPYLQRPLELGADLVLHSLTKYLGGHSDVVGGALCGNDDTLREELAFFQNAVGGTSGPLDAFLVLRGTKTLALRMERHCENALAIARHLEQHEQVAAVIYPGLASHAQHELATRQMHGFGGMVSFELRGGLEAANEFASSTRIFTLAESLGGVESLIEIPASMTHASIPPEQRQASGLADGLVRLSVGVEHVDDLIADLEHAFAAAAKVASSPVG